MNVPNSSVPPSVEMASPSTRILATVLEDRHGYGGGNDCITVIRCNGTLFYVDLSPVFICDSPLTLARYIKFMSCVRDAYPWGDFDDEDPAQTRKHPEEILQDFHAWLITALQPLFLRLVPTLPPSFDPSKLATGEAHPLLSEYLFPDQQYCRLEVDHETPIPIHLPDEEDRWTVTALNTISPELTHSLREQHIPFLDASTIQVSFRQPSHALSRQPTRVLADLTGTGEHQKTTCFLKTFAVNGHESLPSQLTAHLRILQSPLSATARVPRLLGVVTTPSPTDSVFTEDCIAGILLTYIPGRRENEGILSEYTLPNTPPAIREQWAEQIKETVAQMHEAGLVWGDAQAGHVMIDQADEVWLIGMGGRNLEVEVERVLAGTKEGDLWGVRRILGMLREVRYEPWELYGPDDDGERVLEASI